MAQPEAEEPGWRRAAPAQDPVTGPMVRPVHDAFTHEMLDELPAVLRYARVLTGNPSDAEDLVQETYLRAFRARDSYRLGSRPRAWLFTIARNTYFKAHRKASRSTALEDSVDDVRTRDITPMQLATRAEALDRVFNVRELGPALATAIENLSEAHREVVALVDIDELGYHEAADVLDIPVGTVRSRLFRARRLLQQQLMDYAQDSGIASARQQEER